MNVNLSTTLFVIGVLTHTSRLLLSNCPLIDVNDMKFRFKMVALSSELSGGEFYTIAITVTAIMITMIMLISKVT
jgi:hypothetical protein